MQAVTSGRKLLNWSQILGRHPAFLSRSISIKVDDQHTSEECYDRRSDRYIHSRFCSCDHQPQISFSCVNCSPRLRESSSKETSINCDFEGKDKHKKCLSSFDFLPTGSHLLEALWVRATKSSRSLKPSQTLKPGLSPPWPSSLSSSCTSCVQTLGKPGMAGLNLKHHTLNQPTRMYSTGRETLEKKLLHLMDMWKLEDAVALLQKSVEKGVVPHPNVVLDLQQQLANLGEVECLMELQEFLKDHSLISDDRYFRCLQEAYYNSGRVSEGIDVLRLLYHKTRKFADVEVYFTLLTVMVLRHFPDRINLIISFVTDLKDAEIPVLEPEASLWKCYMMMEHWSKADNLLLNNKELQPLLSQQVARVCQNVDKADFARAEVLLRMLDLPFIRQKLRVLVAETLVVELCNQKQWTRVLKILKRIKSLGLPIHADKLSQALENLQQKLTPQFDQQIQDLRLWCDSLHGENKEG